MPALLQKRRAVGELGALSAQLSVQNSLWQ